MNNFEIIKHKLKQFIRKYYINKLIKGLIFFISIGLMYLLITLFLEYLLWLDSIGRMILFWLFIAVESLLLYTLILLPMAKLFKLRQQISDKEASRHIGNHFPEVGDTLLNTLQLAEQKDQSELLLASVNQKSKNIHPVPFQKAVRLWENIKHIPYMLLPVLVVVLIWLSGNWKAVSKSYNRVIHYNIAYQPLAPFQFHITNETLSTIKNKPYTLSVSTVGRSIPETVKIHINQEQYFMQPKGEGRFSYTFISPKSDIAFRFSANRINSSSYQLHVIEAPILLDFAMILDYPKYTGKKDQILKNTGNAIIPEGTKITWSLRTQATARAELITKDTTLLFIKTKEAFHLAKSCYNDLEYTISTSNNTLLRYENLAFSIDIIKDQYPQITVVQEPTTPTAQRLHFKGNIADDYQVTKLQLVYYEEADENNKKIIKLPLKASQFSQFTYTFPEHIPVKEGVNYTVYFEVFDNDALRGGKSAKSSSFIYRKPTAAEAEKYALQDQRKTIENINHSLSEIEQQEEEFRNIRQTNTEKKNLNFNEKRKLRQFLERQQQQEQQQQKFTKELQDNLQEFEKEDRFKKLLEERLKNQEQDIEKNRKYLEELQHITEKLSQEALARKLQEVAKKQQDNKRNLKQLLELTKRYYLTTKAAKLQQDLEQLSKSQEELADKPQEQNTAEKQKELTKQFETFKKETENLSRENQALKKPIQIGYDKKYSQEINKEQKKAEEQLEKATHQQNNKEKHQQAQQSQKKAARKMKQLSQQLQQQIQAGSQEQDAEDARVLRQILDNLLVFSFEQESLLKKFDPRKDTDPGFSVNLRKQQELRVLFHHIDDSLFTLSLRRPEVSRIVNKEISAVYTHMEKALGQLAETKIYQGIASQRYALTAANTLADFLSDVLDNMQQQMNIGSGKGNTPEIQLPDIIQSQEQLHQQLKGALRQQSGTEKPSDASKTDESQAEEQYAIYKQQQQLRQLLKQYSEKSGQNKIVDKLLEDMEHIENDILQNGINSNVLRQMLNLKYRLLELENATIQQGEKETRQSITNKKQYQNTARQQPSDSVPYFNQTEILNRRAVPLHPLYKQKVERYFKNKKE